MFGPAVGAREFNSSVVLFFFLSLPLFFPKNFFLHKVFTFQLPSLSATIYSYYNRVVEVVRRCGGRETFCKLLIKSVF